MSGNYEILEHTADVGLLCKAENLKDLFAIAAKGMLSILVDGNAKVKEEMTITLSEEDTEALFQSWLSEINYILEVHKKLLGSFKIEEIDGKSLKAICGWEHLNPKRHKCLVQIKGVTYHKLYVKEVNSGWEARVIFDL